MDILLEIIGTEFRSTYCTYIYNIFEFCEASNFTSKQYVVKFFLNTRAQFLFVFRSSCHSLESSLRELEFRESRAKKTAAKNVSTLAVFA